MLEPLNSIGCGRSTGDTLGDTPGDDSRFSDAGFVSDTSNCGCGCGCGHGCESFCIKGKNG